MIIHSSANPGIRTANPTRIHANPKWAFLRIPDSRILRIQDSRIRESGFAFMSLGCLIMRIQANPPCWACECPHSNHANPRIWIRESIVLDSRFCKNARIHANPFKSRIRSNILDSCANRVFANPWIRRTMPIDMKVDI